MKKTSGLILAVVVVIAAVRLLWGLSVVDRDPRSVSAYYVANGVAQTGATNLVTGILFDYRGFDTLGEASVIFAAGAFIYLLFQGYRLPPFFRGRSNLIKYEVRLLTPFLFVFGLYILTFGHMSPGGGFQGGVVLATPTVLFCVIFGAGFESKLINPSLKIVLESAAALFLLSVATFTIFLGHSFLEIWRLPLFSGVPGTIASGGIIPLLNFAIGIKVGASIALIIYSMIKETEIEGST